MAARADDEGGARFLLLYALAYAGGVIAYLPLLTLLLPLKVAAVAGPERLGVLTAAALTGAVAASVAGVLWGWASDRTAARGGSRRGWIAAGVALTAASYAGLWLAASPAAIVAAVIAFQLAVNLLLAPLAAMLADRVPDGRKGLAGGLLVLANPLASLASAGLVATAGLGEAARYALLCGMVALLVAPVLVHDRGGPVPERPALPTAARRAGWRLAWSARLLVQVAGNVLSIYLLYYFASVAGGAGGTPASLAPKVGQVQALAYALPLPIAVVLGRWSDRTGRRVPFLIAAAALAAAGLLVMAGAGGWTAAVLGYGAYACGSATFLALNTAHAMQMLPDPRHHGRDLGLLNLTNTLPALIGPALTWAFATADDFRTVLWVLAALTMAGGLVLLLLPEGQAGRATPPSTA